MEERRLMQEEKTRRKLAAIAELKRQREEAELVNCSFKFKARPVPSSSSNRQLEQTKVRLSALKGGDASVSLVRCVFHGAACHSPHAAMNRRTLGADGTGLPSRVLRGAVYTASAGATPLTSFFGGY